MTAISFSFVRDRSESICYGEGGGEGGGDKLGSREHKIILADMDGSPNIFKDDGWATKHKKLSLFKFRVCISVVNLAIKCSCSLLKTSIIF